MSTVSLVTSLLTEDCSRFLPPQHKTLGCRLFGDVCVVQCTHHTFRKDFEIFTLTDDL